MQNIQQSLCNCSFRCTVFSANHFLNFKELINNINTLTHNFYQLINRHSTQLVIDSKAILLLINIDIYIFIHFK